MFQRINIKGFSPPDHLRRILEIENNSFNRDDTFTKSYFMNCHSQCPEGFMVADCDGKIVGYIIVDFSDNAYLDSIAVCPKYRKNGIGRALMNWLEDFCKQKKIDTIKLHVRQSNSDAINFYKKRGYEVIGSEKNFYKDENAHVMQKTL